MSKPSGQTSARWWVLAAIEERPATVAQIARTLHQARQSVQRIADLLEREGSACYQENPHNRRAQLLALTARGRSAFVKIQALQREWANMLGAEIGESELREAGRILNQVLLALEVHRLNSDRAKDGMG